MRLPSEPEPTPQINIVPMIDVIFAVLTFFIMSSLFLTRSEGLPVNLPGAETAELQTQTPLVVTLDPQGGVAINQEAIAPESLQIRITELVAAAEGDQLVVVNADRDVPHGQVVTLMDQLREIPGVRLAIATQRP
ncbi:MAG: biopolymer transporter ExbD [Kaiparowitsia implicata GSE-PSE-MK54-09C]|jgi:biopolymer transport protein ExbD|nr:biopolymer transporter ExbD [Kaiparowitsia implicata GSE-PSE-MK54-09C]